MPANSRWDLIRRLRVKGAMSFGNEELFFSWCNVTEWSLIEIHTRLRGTYCLHFYYRWRRYAPPTLWSVYSLYRCHRESHNTYPCIMPVHKVFIFSTLGKILKSTRSWFRHCATSRKVTGSNPDGVIRIFHWHNRSWRTMALGLTQLLTGMSARNISWEVKAAGA